MPNKNSTIEESKPEEESSIGEKSSFPVETTPKKKKKYIIITSLAIVVISIIVFLVFYLTNKDDPAQDDVLSRTNFAAQEYLTLHHQTNELLTNAAEYPSYEVWSSELDLLIMRWENLETYSADLKTDAQEISARSNNLLNNKVLAYDSQEIIAIYDSAPRGSNSLSYLADQLGTDAKRAYGLLKIALAQAESGAWDEAGDTFELLQTSAQTIQTGCKITAYIGGAILSGGATTTVGAVLGNASLVVSGVDLVLEIGETTSVIAAGYNSDVVALFGDIRTYTAPAATIIGFSSLFYDYKTWNTVGQISAAIFTGEQLTSLFVEDKVFGINIDDLTGFIGVNVKFDPEAKVEGSILNNDENIAAWLNDNGISQDPDSIEVILGLDNIIGKIEPIIVSNEGNKLTPEQLETLAKEAELQHKLIAINSKLDTGIMSCYGNQTDTTTSVDTSFLELEKKDCLNGCATTVDAPNSRTEVCDINDADYPSVGKELDTLRKGCKDRCEPQYQYLMKLNDFGNSETRSAIAKQLKEWYGSCPERCETTYDCIPLQTLSYLSCTNSCNYRYHSQLNAATMMQASVTSASSAEASKCKRDLILNIQAETLELLSEYDIPIPQ